MGMLVLRNARIWDGLSDDYSDRTDITIRDGQIFDFERVRGCDAEVLDLRGAAVLPGLIDAHFHAYAAEVNIPRVEKTPISYLAQHARNHLTAALRRGFTTVRDAGGAEQGLWAALDERLFDGPRLFFSGRALSQTGGHGDSRDPLEDPCGCAHKAVLSQVVDGVDEARKAAREILRRGAHQIKIFVSGGVSSPSDPIWAPQFSGPEIAAIVEVARARRTYVMAHAYTSDSIMHAVGNGVRSIEHGNLLDAETASLMAKEAAFLVPTLIIYEALRAEGDALGLPSAARPKLQEVSERGRDAVRIARQAGVEIGFGTDLLGALHHRQLEEFRLREDAGDTSLDVLKSATSVNARLLNMQGRLGEISPGAFADIIVVPGDPLESLANLYQEGPVHVISRGRRVYSRSA